MLHGGWDDPAAVQAGLRELGELLDGDYVFANLETAALSTEGVIDKQPRVTARAATIDAALAVLEVDLANVANNHAFDALRGGFERTREVASERGTRLVGAGADLEEASAAVLTDVGGLRVGWLGYCDPATRPSHVAGDGPGVNPLEPERARDEVAALSRRCDLVCVSLHWGVEYCHLPAPAHVRLARALVDSGARLVIGHHAHVVQGVEEYRGGLIAYGLGNATTDDFRIDGRLAIRQSDRTRSSMLLRVAPSPGARLLHECVPLRDAGNRVLVDDPVARRHLEVASRMLARGVTESRWRRRRLYEDVVVRTLRKLHPATIGSVQPSHLIKPFRNVGRSMLGRGPVD